ncbi:Uncharacterised protein [Paenibacillus macerans]|uniref:Uncharacterized protein n=1 Tax=Paenibacillus macerans TaxID=44252 RepID=A0A090Y413_PAEMA|nr:hypothetical protein DJ90_4810 [Paenibacillus macerans]SUA86375.1 Uncharacterised protein [Paenibacillus macerans]
MIWLDHYKCLMEEPQLRSQQQLAFQVKQIKKKKIGHSKSLMVMCVSVVILELTDILVTLLNVVGQMVILLMERYMHMLKHHRLMVTLMLQQVMCMQ